MIAVATVSVDFTLPGSSVPITREEWIREGKLHHAPGCACKKPLMEMTGRDLKEQYPGLDFSYQVFGVDIVRVCRGCKGVVEIKKYPDRISYRY